MNPDANSHQGRERSEAAPEGQPAAPSAPEPIRIVVEDRAHGWRVDHYLRRLYPNFSRASWQRAIETGVTLNGTATKPGRRVHASDMLEVILPTEHEPLVAPENIPLEILYEDDDLVAVNKPWGLIVHPGRGNPRGTLAAALQFHFDELSDMAGRFRPGIVHRLDKDTSGVLVVAKNNQIHDRLSRQFEARTVEKVYQAVVRGSVNFDSDWIETHIRVHPRVREKMQVCVESPSSRHAATFYEVVDRFEGFTHVRLYPKTGRTHQLRVHMQHIGHPIVADRAYGGHPVLLRSEIDPAVPSHSREDRPVVHRQALHAHRLTLNHPGTDEPLMFEAPLPPDMRGLLEVLGGGREEDGR